MKPIPLKANHNLSLKHMKYVNSIVTDLSITVVLSDDSGERVYTVQKASDPTRYMAVKDCLTAGRHGDLPGVLDASFALRENFKSSSGGGWEVSDHIIKFNGEPIQESLQKKMLALASAGIDVEPIQKFWERCLRNPSQWSRDQLFNFIDKNGVTVRTDGTFLLYKGIRRDWHDKHTGRVLHEIGKSLPELSVGNFDQNPRQECGSGYHAAPWEYVKSRYGGERIVELAIDPAMVISVPHADQCKIRCRTYLVVREITNSNDPRVNASSRVKVGEVESPEVAKTGAGRALQTAKKVVRKVMKKFAGLTIVATTDRITIPSSLTLDYQFVAGGTAVVWATDPRSRFLVVVPGRFFGTMSKNQKVHWHKDIQILSNGSVSIRAAVLSQAKIWTGSGSSYKVSVNRNNLLEIRPA